jgi:magnesium transporter
VRETLAGSFEPAVDVADCDGERLLRLVPIERVLAADPGTPLRELLEPPVVVPPDADREHVALRAAHHQRRSAAVVDEHGLFLGVVPPEMLLRVLLAEHEEDVARLGGLRASTSLARRVRRACQAPPLASLPLARHRLARRHGLGSHRRRLRRADS